MMSPLQMAERMMQAAVTVDEEIVRPTEALMVLVAAQAREVLGTYRWGWQELAPATQADRVRQGYPDDEPLLRTGMLAESIKHMARRSGSFTGAEGLVYSDDVVALYQELGTSKIPPRSFLFGSMVRAVPDMERIFGAFAVRVLTEGLVE